MSTPPYPVTPAEPAAEAAAAVSARAEAVHLHARGGDGTESVLAGDVGAAAAVRSACPGTPVGVSTGLWIIGGDQASGLRPSPHGPIFPPKADRTSRR